MGKFQNLVQTVAAAAILSAAFIGTASAGVIFTPVAATIDVGGPGFGSITDTFNHASLTPDYISGVTDFAAYMLLNPQHTQTFAGFEWFSNQGTTAAQVTYDLGSVMTIDALALWNEESSGIGVLDLYSSSDNVTFTALSLGLLPTDNPLTGGGTGTYGADQFFFSPTALRYVQFRMSGCPQPDPGSFAACAIGEVAFDVPGNVTGVPEPATLALFGAGLAGLGALRRRKAKKA